MDKENKVKKYEIKYAKNMLINIY